MSPKAPPLANGRWLSVAPPPTAELVGQVSILVFWSPTCEASLTRLREIEFLIARSVARHGETLRAIGILSPRYPFERRTEYAKAAIARHRITMPVLHDADMEVWSRYNPGGWPATIVIDHRRRAIGALLGLEEIDVLIEAAEMAALDAAASHRARRPAPAVADLGPMTQAEVVDVSERPWLWPSGVAALPDDRIAVADTGNDRVVILELSSNRRSARIEACIGGLTQPGKVTAWGPDSIAISLPELGQVVAVDRREPRRLKLVAEDLGRPQGLVQDRDGTLVVCDAVNDQLVRIIPGAGMGVLAGIGLTGLLDGAAAWAELAQPVGIARCTNGLAFVDAGSNNLRLLTDAGQVVSVTHNTFERFGLVDGPAHRAVLQRPTGLAVRHDGSVLVADTGNDRIRIVAERRVRTLGLAGLQQPEDVAVLSDGTVVVADTGNHRLILAEPETRSAWPLQLL